MELEIPLQSSAVEDTMALPSSPAAAQADVTVDVPFVAPSCSLAIQAKRALLVRNALVASNVLSCSVAALVDVVQENVMDGGKQVELDEYVEMLRLLPEVRGKEAFHPLEDTLKRIYRSFHAAKMLDLQKLGIGSLLLVSGSIEDKLSAAIQLSLDGVNPDVSQEKIARHTADTALLALLLSVSSVFDVEDASGEQLEATAAILSASVRETTSRIWASHGLAASDSVTVQQVWDWIEQAYTSKTLVWIKLVDQARWPVLKRLTSPLPSHSHDGGTNSEAPTSTDGDDEYSGSQSALSFRFSGVDGGVLIVGEPEAEVLFDLLMQSAFTKVHAQTMYDTFVQHTGDGLLEEESFLEAIEELVSMTDAAQLMQDSAFLDTMLQFFHCFLPEGVAKVDAFEIAAGFSLFAWGSKSDKLASSFHYFDVDSKGFLHRQQLWRFLRSVLIALLFLSPPAENVLQRYGSIAELVDTGEHEIMDNITEGMSELENDEDDQAPARARTQSEARLGVFSFEEFGLWYNAGGFRGMSWLELLDLRKWAFVSAHFALDQLDAEPVDPVVASANYYSAQNIRVDVDAGNGATTTMGMMPRMDQRDRQRLDFPHAIEEDEDEDGDDHEDEDRPRAFPHSHSSYSSASTGPSSRFSSARPAILLKNEVVLEFALEFDDDDGAAAEVPLTTLSFDNGDLLQFAELQRVMKLHELELAQLFDVFEPYMETAATAWMDKAAFDACVLQLLPVEIASSVAASFGVHTHTRVPPPSIGRGNDVKMLADTLSRLFFAFNRGGTGKIDLVEFVSAFTLFCAGSKSEKLAFAYRLLDADGDGALTRREMWKFLRSFLTMLLALGNGAELSAEALASVADATATAIAGQIFRDTNKTFSTRPPVSSASVARQSHVSHRFSIDTPESADTVVASRNAQRRRGQYQHRGSLPNANTVSVEGANAAGPGAASAFVRGGVVSFEEFAKWYTSYGFNMITWIELLDAKKWPRVGSDVAEAILRYISRQQRALAEAARRGSGQGPGSGSSVEDSASSFHEGRSSSMDAEYDTPLSVAQLLTSDDGYVGHTVPETTRGEAGGVERLFARPTSATASSRDLSSVALQFKLTSYDNATLRIRLKDVAIVYTVAERMGFRGMPCEALLNLFNVHGVGGGGGKSLTKLGFLKTMRELVPRDELSNEDQEFLSFHLLRVFALFEAESVLDDEEEEAEEDGEEGQEGGGQRSTSSVDKLQLTAGMSVFCQGSKSAKLGVLFKLFDTHGDGYVSRRHLFEMLKSILVVLFAFSSFNASRSHSNDTAVNTWSTTSAAERAAGAVISKLFCEAACHHADAITLAEFATWYANGGYLDCPWLELLDLSKWPAKEAFEASKKEKPLLYAFETASEDSSLLHFSESDISTYLFMLRSTKLRDVNVSKLYDALLAYATPSAEEALKLSRAQQQTQSRPQYSYAAVEEDEGAYLELSRSNFYECIRSLVPKDEMSDKAQQTSSKLLSRLFNVFDRKRGGRVNALELACGLSILGKGTKSQKLSMAFEFITKMRQQRHKALSAFASSIAGVPAYNNAGGVNSIATGGGGGAAYGWLTSARGALSTASGLRRSMQQQSDLDALPHSVLFIYLRSFLLALMALSDGTYRLGLEKMYAEADDFITEAMGDLMTEVATVGGGAYAGYGTARSRARVTFEQFGEWYNTSGYELVSWVELLDVSKWVQQQEFQENAVELSKHKSKSSSQRGGHGASSVSTQLVEPLRTSPKPRTTHKKQIRQSDIVPSSYQPRSRGHKPPLSTHRESMGAKSLSSDGPILVFAISEQAAELEFFHDDVARLQGFLHESKLHKHTASHLSSALLASLQLSTASHAVEVSRSHVIAAFQNVSCTRPGETVDALSEASLDLMHSLLEVFVREPPSSYAGPSSGGDAAEDDDLPEDRVSIASVLCGLFVFCDGTLLEKLQTATRLLLHESCEPTDMTLGLLKQALVCFLMALFGVSSSLSGEVVRHSADLGADDVLQSFTSAVSPSAADGDHDDSGLASRRGATRPLLDLSAPVSLRAFADWFSDAGYHSHPWLELSELQHWPPAIDISGALDEAEAV